MRNSVIIFFNVRNEGDCCLSAPASLSRRAVQGWEADSRLSGSYPRKQPFAAFKFMTASDQKPPFQFGIQDVSFRRNLPVGPRGAIGRPLDSASRKRLPAQRVIRRLHADAPAALLGEPQRASRLSGLRARPRDGASAADPGERRVR